MRKIFFFSMIIFLISCTNNSLSNIQIEDNDKIAICGELNGQKQTFPTMKDLKENGAKFLFYGPCYEQ